MVLQSVLRVSSSHMRTSVGDGSVVLACVISTRVNVTNRSTINNEIKDLGVNTRDL